MVQPVAPASVVQTSCSRAQCPVPSAALDISSSRGMVFYKPCANFVLFMQQMKGTMMTDSQHSVTFQNAADVVSLTADELTAHPLAEILPMMRDDEMNELTESIDCVGQQEPVVMFEGKVLDGRNRVEACRRLGCPVEARSFSGTNIDALEFVTDSNLQRREMTASQKACAAVDLIPHLREGVQEERRKKITQRALEREKRRRDPAAGPDPCINAGICSDEITTADIAANILAVSTRYVNYAQQLKSQRPVVFAAVKAGAKTLTAAMNETQGTKDSEFKRLRNARRSVSRLVTQVEGYPEVCDLLTQALARLEELQKQQAEQDAQESDSVPPQLTLDPNPDPTVTWQ